MRVVSGSGRWYMSVLKRLFSVATALVAISSVATGTGSSASYAQDVSKQQSLTALNYITGWSHDAVGYHPAIYMLVENTSAHDLTGKVIRLQARFTDLQTAEVTIGRLELRKEFKPHQQIPIKIEGARGFELPFETHLWPSIECKVMCRVGNVGDEGTETMLIAKIEQHTHSADEAFQALNETTSYNAARHHAPHPHHSPAAHRSEPEKLVEKPPEKPLVAKAEKLGAVTPRATTKKTKPDPTATALSLLTNSKSLPGLGDDFYNFEQKFGQPVELDLKKSDFTWARYRHSISGSDIVTGSRERTGKVDVIVMRIPRNPATDEFVVINAAKQLAGKLKGLPIGQPTRSVRYLPSGRLELVSCSGQSYKVVCLIPDDDNDNSFIIVLSRLPQEMESLMSSLPAKSSLLKSLQFLQAKDHDGKDD